MKNLSILISFRFFLGLACFKKSRWGICYSICLFLTIIDLEVISRKFMRHADLTRTHIICIHELLEIIMISRDKNLIFTSFQVVAPSFKSPNDIQKLLLIGFVMYLSRNHPSREKGYEVPLAKLWG